MTNYKMPVSKCHLSAILSNRIAIPKTYGPSYGESFSVEIFMKIDLYERGRFFPFKNSLSFAAKRGSKHNDGT